MNLTKRIERIHQHKILPHALTWISQRELKASASEPIQEGVVEESHKENWKENLIVSPLGQVGILESHKENWKQNIFSW